MTLQQLQYFCELAKIQHYTKTAAQLHISQPSLSYAIAELEREVEAKLFDRSSRKISLTPEGKILFEHVSQALALINTGVENVRSISGNAPVVLRVGYIHSIGNSIIPQFMDLFHTYTENLPVRLNFVQALDSDLKKGLENDELDIIFSIQKPRNAVSFPIYHQPLQLYVPESHPLAKESSVDLVRIVDEKLILVNSQSSLRYQVEECLRPFKKTPHVVLEANNCDAVLSYVSRGYGIAILPESDLSAVKNVREVAITEPPLSRDIFISWSHGLRNNEPLSLKIQQIADELAGLQLSGEAL